MTTALDIRTSPLGGRLLAHFSVQLDSASRLLDLTIKQQAAIRARDVDTVLTGLAAIQSEMDGRAALERERMTLLNAVGQHLNVPAHTVTLEQMTTLLHPEEADLARQASAQLRGMLTEIQNQHQLNRQLMKQELAFLDHLIRMLSGNQASPYSAMDFRA